MYRCLRVPLDGEPNILSKEARRGYRLAREYKVPIVFNYTDPNFDRIEYSEKLKRRLHLVIKRFRDLKFVFSHLGGPYYSDVAQWMKESVNIYADTSYNVIELAVLKTELEFALLLLRFMNMV